MATASPGFGPLTIETPPTAIAKLSDVKKTDTGVTFVVTYSNPGDTIVTSTIDSNDILVTNDDRFPSDSLPTTSVPW